MYTIILVAIIGIVIGVYQEIKDFGWEWDAIFSGILGAIVGAFAGFLIAWALPQNYTTDKWSEKIVSLKDNASVSGSFFLKCGQINGTMKYVYYLQNNDSTYQMWQANYYDAAIKYSDGQPKINITWLHSSKSLWNKFAIDLNENYGQTYVFEVPKGSIKNSYELDAQ